jgi:hypothetical protein
MSVLGTIYFVQELPAGPIKIGWTANSVSERVHNVQTGNPREVVLIGIIGGSTQLNELSWHHRFHGCRCSGEWFWPTQELREAIATEAAPAPAITRKRRLKRLPSHWAQALQRWVSGAGKNQYDIAEIIDRTNCYASALMFGRKRPTAEMARKIEVASKGAVPASLLLAAVQVAA